MAQQTPQPTGDQAAIVKGKSPRNAILGVGLVAAVLIAAIGFYFQVKDGNQAAEEAKLKKSGEQAAAVKKPVNDDIDKIIADQASAAKRAAASDARPVSAPTTEAPAQGTRPGLTADAFMHDPAASNFAAKTAQDNIYASPIFRPGVKVNDQATQQQTQPSVPGLPTPQQVAAQQAAAQLASLNAAAGQAQVVKAGQGAGGMTTQQRDTQFMNDAKAQSSSGEGFLAAGFVGQSHGCTLPPPAHIPVLTVEGLNSDRPGTANLVVEQDVYDSLGRLPDDPEGLDHPGTIQP